ncbi:hypothetical protein KZ829_23480 [Actinoplanes hulinensis]|uniref:Uncharacterized protein n=1 Tax=Actinoplanes hulinensis TaxID=1144547 RepID=A0ABS7B6N4_9ACTN|nr:hypothetical protein [Actinoplanes hulinensis]MBW6436708.1 hypothetical protein [Actinoplanes hulinensis]
MNRTQNPTGPAADTTTDVVVTPALTLRGAADYLELRGWTQRYYYGKARPFPPACATGALGMAADGTVTNHSLWYGPASGGDAHRAWRYLLGYLAEHGETTSFSEPGLTSVADWNDQDDQTAENVIATLRAAADEYDWQHASEDDVETYADSCTWAETWPTREGFLAWLKWRAGR